MLNGMWVSNTLTIDTEKANVLGNLLGDWLGSVSYIPVKLEIQFPPGNQEGARARVITGSPNSTPREDVAATE